MSYNRLIFVTMLLPVNKQQEVYRLVSKIPKGRIMTYGQIAKALGIKNPRLVGYYLHHNPDSKKIPCHRVVDFSGKLAKNFAFGGQEGQRKKLKAEGVVLKNYRVKLKDYLWQD